jgi:hypothetical protein
LASIEQALQNSLNDFFVALTGGLGPFVVFDVKFLPKIDKLLRNLFHKFSWRHTRFGGGLLNLLAVLIHTS